MQDSSKPPSKPNRPKTAEEWERHRKEQREDDRKRLLSLNELEAERLPTPEKYQRMRYLREIEAYHWLQEIRNKQVTEGIDRKIEEKRYGSERRLRERD